MRSLGTDALTFLSAALLIALSGCLDTSVDFHVEPGPGDDAEDAASPQDTEDMVGGETLVDLLDAATDLTDALIPTDTGDVPVDDTEDIEDTSDGGAPDLLDTAEDADAPDPIDALDTHDVDDADAGCTPNCDGKVCGDDGCDGSCGDCNEDLVCAAGLCLPPEYSLSCEGRCGETGVNCGCDEACFTAGSCCADICVEFCFDLLGCTCGDGVCEGIETCETCEMDCGCEAEFFCLAGFCCAPDCQGKKCGGDGCGGSCGTCTGPQEACVGGACVCQPACDGSECGPDGCGGACGACDDGLSCTDDACESGLCTHATQPFFCLIEGICVPSGTENPLNPCEKCKPAEDQAAWSPREDGFACGAAAVCWQGWCCYPAAFCVEKECGDDGCGWVCGACDPNESCGDDGLCACVAGGVACGDGCCEPGQVCDGGICCHPACGGMNCGDDGCGGSCGTCIGAQDACINGLCVCQPACAGLACGPDGCGSGTTCGECVGQDACVDGACVCQPDCGGKNCGPDGCGGICGTCGDNEICTAGGSCDCAGGGAACGGGCCSPGEICHCDACCAPDCVGKSCGSDGCGGQCGVCTGQDACEDGLCVCQPLCTGKECGPDGCGDDCGTCTGQDVCVGCACVCKPACTGNCGPDGCGGTCGDCDDGLPCTLDTCVAGACVATTDPGACLIGGACVSTGDENPLNPCEICLPSALQEDWTLLEDGTPCGGGMVCHLGFCCDTVAGCTGKECGSDGCGGTCGTCTGPQDACVEGLCVCQGTCSGKTCGDDGCGGGCGTCELYEVCTDAFACACMDGAVACGDLCCEPEVQVCADGVCCAPDCAGKECGVDGCGGSCGDCDPDQFCIAQLCPDPGDQCDDLNTVSWDGCTDGQVTEFQGNSFTTNDQRNPDVAVNGAEQFLVVWESMYQDGDDLGVFGQLFGPDGGPIGAETQVNVHVAGIQEAPRVASLSDGRFVVAWASDQQSPDASGFGVFARTIGTDGAPEGTPFLVNNHTNGDQSAPAVVGTDAGFIVAWEGKSNADAKGIWCRAFLADGTAVKPQSRVNTETTNQQESVALAPLDGGAVAVWMSKNQDGDGWGIFGQRLSPTCTKVGPEFQVNSVATGQQEVPVVATLDSGVFLVAWNGNIEGGVDSEGVGARRFSSTGQALGAEFTVNETMEGTQEFPCVTAAGGGFVIAWEGDDEQYGTFTGVFFQRLSTINVVTGPETQVNVFWDKDQQAPACAAFSDGSFVIAWEGHNDQDGNGSGIFVRRYDADGLPLYR